MIRLRGIVALVVWWIACAGAARAPKIYNALITSDENLSPSQAFPVVAPYAQQLFQPLIVHHHVAPASQNKDEKLHDAYPLYPLAYDPYLQYGYHRDYVYSPPLPFYQQPVYIDYGQQQQPEQQPLQPNTHDGEKSMELTQDVARPQIPVLPPQMAQAAPPHVNFKKNPDIPDVIPPLPFTLRKDKKQKRNYS